MHAANQKIAPCREEVIYSGALFLPFTLYLLSASMYIHINFNLFTLEFFCLISYLCLFVQENVLFTPLWDGCSSVFILPFGCVFLAIEWQMCVLCASNISGHVNNSTLTVGFCKLEGRNFFSYSLCWSWLLLCVNFFLLFKVYYQQWRLSM